MRVGALTVADSGVVSFETTGLLTVSGASGAMTVRSGVGAAASAGGILTIQSGAGGVVSGAGGLLQLVAGNASGIGAGGAATVTAGNAAGTGAGGAVTVTAGNAAGVNQAGGAASLTGGNPTGTGAPGPVTLTAASNTANVGGNVTLVAGAGSAVANDGVVQIARVPTSNRAARLQFLADNGTSSVSLKAPAAATTYIVTLPTAQGAAGTVLQNNGTGTLSWVSLSSVSSQLVWGRGSVAATTVTRYLTPGFDDTLAPTSPVACDVVRAGNLRNMRVRHNTPAGNGAAIVYTLRVNGVATALSVSLASTSAAGSDTVNSIAVAAGASIDIEVTKLVSTGASPSDVTVAVEFA